jgi:hypothetical protein
MEGIDVSAVKVEPSISTDQVYQEQPYPVSLIKVKTACKDEPNNWTEVTAQSAMSYVTRQHGDTSTVKHECIDVDDKVTVSSKFPV